MKKNNRLASRRYMYTIQLTTCTQKVNIMYRLSMIVYNL